MNTCSVCGTPIIRTGSYCHQCGSSFNNLKLKPEYRYVTVLCTDLSGYTTLSERLDNEDLREFMEVVLGEITAVINRFGGAVEKYIGDAVVAIFGNVMTREDDPVRGILAAREIHSIVRGMSNHLPEGSNMRLDMHTGINTGEVLMAPGSTRHSTHGTLGRTINIASRLCDLASAGEILVSETLVSEAMRYFHLEWMGRKILKGFRRPLHVYKVLGERAIPLEVHRVGGIVSPLVGREQELSILLSRAKELLSGRGGAISLVGEAGIGKSRLLKEFKASINDRISCITATCFEYTSTTPYVPFSMLLHTILGRDHFRGDITRALSRQGLSDEYASELSFFMNMASSKGVFPGSLKEKVCDAVLWLLNSVAMRDRTVFCIEDIHWADQSSIDLLTYLIHKWDNTCPCLLVLTYRSSFGPFFHDSRLFLRELHEQDVERMLKYMFDSEVLSGETVGFLAHATGGNPFFIEEMANYLLEKGCDLASSGRIDLEDSLPSTLYGLISSRLDHMKPSSKRLLQEAALIGRVFSETMLLSVCSDKGSLQEGLNELIKHGFIQDSGNGEYFFKHDITRDVASRTLLKKERVLLHKKIAYSLENSLGGSLSDHIGELAHHFGKAQEFEKAIHYDLEAGRSCEASGAYVEAGSHYVSAKQYLQKSENIQGHEDLLVETLEGVWRCCRVFDPVRAISSLEDLSAYYKSKELREKEAYCTIRLINLYSQRGLFKKAYECYADSLTIVPDNPVLTAAAHTAFAYTYTFLGRPRDALSLLDKSRSVLQDSDSFLYTVNMLTSLAASVWKGDIEASLFWYSKTKDMSSSYIDIDLIADMWLGHIWFLAGRFDEAIVLFKEVSSREKKLGRISGGLSYLRIQGSIYFSTRYLGDIKGAEVDLEAFQGLKEEIHNASLLHDLYCAWIKLANNEHSRAKDLVLRSLPGLKDGFANRVPYALNALAEAYHNLGDYAAASDVAMESIYWNEKNGNAEQLIWALRIYADICITRGELRIAHDRISQAYSLARSARMKPQQAWAIALFGKYLRAGCQQSKAIRCFRKARKLWKEMCNPVQEKVIEKELEAMGST